jgi:L-asparaginase/beta-aspartyl-peptidase (threonine type)
MHETKQYAVVAHGGVGADPDAADGCRAAVDQAIRAIREGKDALAAAIAAVVHMENDGRFNAGTGAVLALDGETIEMDAAVMDTRGRLGMVACIQKVRNPVLVARGVADTPHVCLACEGAIRFARMMGHEHFYQPTRKSRETHCDMIAGVRQGRVRHQVQYKEFEKYWNYTVPVKPALEKACDTIGAVVRDPDGHFAVAASTGGSSPALLGRVGDTPMVGSGFYAGPHGAVAATGIGENIVRELLCFRVYQWIEQGMRLQQALERGVALFDKDIDVGLIAVSKTEMGACANKPMPKAEASHG